jgi:hypothetical protein
MIILSIGKYGTGEKMRYVIVELEKIPLNSKVWLLIDRLNYWKDQRNSEIYFDGDRQAIISWEIVI